MYQQSARVYDAIYLPMKDYGREAAMLADVIARHTASAGRRLLDVACGTGLHLQYLQHQFEVEGLDLQPEMLAIARQRLPGVRLHQADMTNFDLGQQYDVLLCLFSSIGYTRTLDRLAQALACMHRHLLPGGVLLVEPWFTPEAWRPHTVHAVFVDQPDLKIARINTSLQEGRLSILELHHLVGDPQGTSHFIERHELGLFETSEMTATFLACGFHVAYDPQGLTGRGMYIARKPLEREQHG